MRKKMERMIWTSLDERRWRGDTMMNWKIARLMFCVWCSPLIDLSLDEKPAEHSMQSVDGSIESKTQKSQYLKLAGRNCNSRSIVVRIWGPDTREHRMHRIITNRVIARIEAHNLRHLISSINLKDNDDNPFRTTYNILKRITRMIRIKILLLEIKLRIQKHLLIMKSNIITNNVSSNN